MNVHSINDAALANTAYLLELDGGLGISVDARRDVDDHLDLADRLGLRIVADLETHIHADFVTGSLELAAATGAEIIGPVDAEFAFDHRGVSEGDTLVFDGVEVHVIATPGHTPEHVSYVVADDGRPVGVFSGGSLIAGGAARTDLIAPDLTEPLARRQFHSLRRLAELPDDAVLWPTHGAGSFCSAGPGSGGDATIGEQRRVNPLLSIDDEDEFVRRLLGGYGSFPPYFLALRTVNRRGPRPVAELDEPRALDAEEVVDLIDGGAWFIDARPIEEWAVAHPRGAVSNVLRPAFASWLGWFVPFGAPIVLLIDPGEVGHAVTLARRIGYDAVAGWLDGGVEAWRRSGRPVDSVEAIDAHEAARRVERGARLVDVRQVAEVDQERIPGARHLELGDIVAGSQPNTSPVVTFCGHGERSATAASFLERRGVDVAYLVGGLPAWEDAGLPVER